MHVHLQPGLQVEKLFLHKFLNNIRLVERSILTLALNLILAIVLTLPLALTLKAHYLVESKSCPDAMLCCDRGKNHIILSVKFKEFLNVLDNFA